MLTMECWSELSRSKFSLRYLHHLFSRLLPLSLLLFLFLFFLLLFPVLMSGLVVWS